MFYNTITIIFISSCLFSSPSLIKAFLTKLSSLSIFYKNVLYVQKLFPLIYCFRGPYPFQLSAPSLWFLVLISMEISDP